ncbi:uncharacterized protein B0H64DRAFT_37656 [Chaetomium fimeti]|uniref:Uncharacterized protein n=1 Tax=Chaetomium fimeti TaxID=1854472 RepID=A0AAE0HRM1_9PEZI|nr:hypothetical protein B0H64DRAFT_37656 [Chaetomium fimeti]
MCLHAQPGLSRRLTYTIRTISLGLPCCLVSGVARITPRLLEGIIPCRFVFPPCVFLVHQPRVLHCILDTLSRHTWYQRMHPRASRQVQNTRCRADKDPTLLAPLRARFTPSLATAYPKRHSRRRAIKKRAGLPTGRGWEVPPLAVVIPDWPHPGFAVEPDLNTI